MIVLMRPRRATVGSALVPLMRPHQQIIGALIYEPAWNVEAKGGEDL
jgi:hypothetical protein